MVNFINPLELILILTLLIIAAFGTYNGLINECKKIISLFLSMMISKMVLQYVPFLSDILNPLLSYLIILLFLIYIIRLLFNLIIRSLPSLSINQNTNKFIGGIIALLKGLLLISILLFIVELSPIQDSIKKRFFNKSNNVSIIFNACDNIKNFIL